MAKLRLDKPELKEAPKGKAAKAPTAKSLPKPRAEAAAKRTTAPKAQPVPTEVNERIGYLLQCPPGLAPVLTKELNFVGATTRDQKLFVKLQRNHDLLFVNHVKSDDRLAELRTDDLKFRNVSSGSWRMNCRRPAHGAWS
jgi:hypothetical protein